MEGPWEYRAPMKPVGPVDLGPSRPGAHRIQCLLDLGPMGSAGGTYGAPAGFHEILLAPTMSMYTR